MNITKKPNEDQNKMNVLIHNVDNYFWPSGKRLIGLS